MMSSAISVFLQLMLLAFLMNVSSTSYLGRRGHQAPDELSPAKPPYGHPGHPIARNKGEDEYASASRQSGNQGIPGNRRPWKPPLGGVSLGPVCTHSGQRCLSTAHCLYSQQKCQCPASHPEGDGLLECTHKGNVICSVDCDPIVQTWRKARVPLNLPCWYRVTHFYIPIHPQPHHSIFKWCQVQVRALNSLTEGGLFFVGAVMVDVSVAGMDGSKFFVHGDSSRRLEITAQEARKSTWTGQDSWTVWEKHAPFWAREDVKMALGGRLEVLTTWNPENRYAILRIPRCKVKIKYRPFGKVQPQMLKPGLTVTLPDSDDIHFTKHYLSSLCLTFNTTSNTYKSDAKRWKLRNGNDAGLFYVLLQRNLNVPPSKNPAFHEQCGAIRNHLQHKFCKQDRYLAINLCAPLLNQRHHFLTRLGKALVMKVVEKCVAWACFGQREACKWFHRILRHKRCQPTYLMKAIGCNDVRRRKRRNEQFTPVPGIHDIIFY